jgi:hypothetical protein
MDWTFLQITGWILLGWVALAVVVTAAFSALLRGARRKEQQFDAGSETVGEWVRGDDPPRAA